MIISKPIAVVADVGSIEELNPPNFSIRFDMPVARNVVSSKLNGDQLFEGSVGIQPAAVHRGLSWLYAKYLTAYFCLNKNTDHVARYRVTEKPNGNIGGSENKPIEQIYHDLHEQIPLSLQGGKIMTTSRSKPSARRDLRRRTIACDKAMLKLNPEPSLTCGLQPLYIQRRTGKTVG